MESQEEPRAVSRFSERYGYRPPREAIQHDWMDDRLRTGLWNALDTYFWDRVEIVLAGMMSDRYLSLQHNRETYLLCWLLWRDFFEEPIDTMRDTWGSVLPVIRDFFFSCEWFEVYDFVEFVASAYPDERRSLKFQDAVNEVLEKYCSAWRFVAGEIARVTTEVEIEAIEAVPESPARLHIGRALELFSDRDNPDYRNSVKESISAVEAAARQVTGNEKATLGDAIRVLEKSQGLHPAMAKALAKLYGYTSDQGGIRHALLEEDQVTLQEARFMLVACSAFVSFLLDAA